MDDDAAAAERRSRRFVILILLFAAFLLVAAFVLLQRKPAGPQACTLEAIEVNGRSYGRDPKHDCQFVDENGNVIHQP